MIPVTNEPMEGIAFDVQDHARRTGTIWTGTHGEMTRSDLHGACYRAVCFLGHRLKDGGQTGETGTFPTQCHLDGEVLSV
jgi:hypothetical protein